jgi:hypothetical protein
VERPISFDATFMLRFLLQQGCSMRNIRPEDALIAKCMKLLRFLIYAAGMSAT